MQSVGMTQMLASLCCDLFINSYLSAHSGDVLIVYDCCTNSHLLIQHCALNHSRPCKTHTHIDFILLNFQHKLFLIHLKQILIKSILTPIPRQMIQQMRIQSIKVLLIHHLFDVYSTNVDAFAIETHFFLVYFW